MTASPLEGEQRPQQGFFKDPLEEFFTFSDDDTETNSVGLGHDRKGPSLSVKAGVASRESLSSVPVSPAIPILTVSQVTDDFFDTAATSVVPGTPLADLGLGSLSMHSPSAVSVSSLSQVASTVSPSALGLNLGATSTSFLSPSLAIVPPPTKNGFLCAPGGAAQGLSTNPVARSPLTGMQQQFDDFTIGGDVSESGYFSPSVAVSEGYLSPAVAISEGYFSPSVALAEGWTPEILCIPSPLIHAIPSPMPYFSNGFNQSPLMSASPQLRLALENQHLAQQMRMHQGQQQQTFPHSTPETMQKFWASNSGLGLNNPNKLDIQTLSHDPELQVSFESMLVSLGLAPEEVQDNPSQGTGQQSQQPQQSSFSALGLVQPSVPSTVSRSAFPKPPAYPRPVQASSSTETLVDKAESQPTSVCASPSVPLSGGERRKPFWNLVKSDGRTLYQCPYQDCGKSKFLAVMFFPKIKNEGLHLL